VNGNSHPLYMAAAAFMAGFAAHELATRPQSAATIRRALRRVSPRSQAVIEKWIARGHDVMIEQGERQLHVWVRNAGGKVREVAIPWADVIEVDGGQE
jgi:hypothetical protein